MPTYLYSCGTHRWDVIKRVAEIDARETCPDCGGEGERRIQAPMLDPKIGDWNRTDYNPALGCVTKGTKHARQIAKQRGLIEVGNENPDKIHKAAEKRREEIRDDRWKEADREKVYD